jgi:hypothetical protein
MIRLALVLQKVACSKNSWSVQQLYLRCIKIYVKRLTSAGLMQTYSFA